MHPTVGYSPCYNLLPSRCWRPWSGLQRTTRGRHCSRPSRSPTCTPPQEGLLHPASLLSNHPHLPLTPGAAVLPAGPPAHPGPPPLPALHPRHGRPQVPLSPRSPPDPWPRLSPWRVALALLACCLAWHWLHMYRAAWAAKHATLIQVGQINRNPLHPFCHFP